jgi:hypothetical protein
MLIFELFTSFLRNLVRLSKFPGIILTLELAVISSYIASTFSFHSFITAVFSYHSPWKVARISFSGANSRASTTSSSFVTPDSAAMASSIAFYLASSSAAAFSLLTTLLSLLPSVFTSSNNFLRSSYNN